MMPITLALAAIFLLVLDLTVAPSAGRYRTRIEWTLPVCACVVITCAVLLAVVDQGGW